MKKVFSILMCVAIFSSCEKEKEEEIDPICHLIYWAPAFFHIKIRDSEGNDLIKNGRYDKEVVKVIYEGQVIGSAGQGWSSANIQNDILFQAAGPGDKDYFVFLNEEDTDTIQIPAILQRFCGVEYYAAQSVIYNGKELNNEEDFYNIIVVK